jgi:hypothetical protein
MKKNKRISKETQPQSGVEENKNTNQNAFILGVDYYFNENGLMVLTKDYHLKRGSCCKSGCLHCPYGFTNKK